MENICVLLVGGSSSGKDSVAHELVKAGYAQLLSYTTRPQRVGEKDTHIFITDDEVNQYKEDIIAYTEIGKYKYFATKQQLRESDLYVIDPTGCEYLKRAVKDIRFITIHINLSTEERFTRAVARGDKVGDIISRFINESDRFKQFMLNGEYDYSITNYDLDKTVKIIKSIIRTEMEYE